METIDGNKRFEKIEYKERAMSARIEVSRDRLYRSTDPVEISKIFFPQKNSFAKRASFVAIMFELRKAKNQHLEDLNHIPKKYDINETSFIKARQIMVRIGLIKKTSGQWHFSTRFEKAMERLIQNIDVLMAVPTQDDLYKEGVFIESAKREPVYYKLRKKDNKEQNDEEPDGLDEFKNHNQI